MGEDKTESRSDWFNHRRLVEGIGYVPPTELEEAYYRQCQESAIVA